MMAIKEGGGGWRRGRELEEEEDKITSVSKNMEKLEYLYTSMF